MIHESVDTTEGIIMSNEEVEGIIEEAIAKIEEMVEDVKEEIAAVVEEAKADITEVVEEAPVEEVPVEEAPAEEAPVEEAPVEETPAEEPAAEGPTEEEVALWVAAVTEIMERDGVSEDEANTNLINLLKNLEAEGQI